MPEFRLDWPIAIAVLGTLVGGFMKGAAGTGFPLIATPLVSLALGPRAAVLAVSLPTLLFNTIQSLSLRGNWRTALEITPMLLGEIAGLPLGVWLLVNLDPKVLSIAIGVGVLGFVIHSLVSTEAALPRRQPLTHAVGAGLGFMGGAMGGTTGFFGPPLTIFLLLLKLDKNLFVFLMSVSFQVVTVTQCALYYGAGLYNDQALFQGALLCVPGMVGFVIGVRLRARISQRLFYRLITAILIVSGTVLIVRPLVFG